MSSNIENLFSSIKIFSHCSNIDHFRDWLKQYPEVSEQSIFQGYKFFVNLSAIMLHDAIARDYSFDLEENSTYYIAISRGIDLDDIPNDCERVIFLKNVWKAFESIRRSHNWEELKDNIHKSQGIITLYQKEILPNIKISTKDKTNFSEEEIIEFVTKRQVLFKLNDTSHGIPVGAIAKMISPSDGFYQPSFEGYVYSLEFLWYQLLGQKKFQKSPAKEIHKTKSLLSSEEYDEKTRDYFDFHEDDPVSREWYIYHDVLGTFFGKIYETEIEPTHKKIRDHGLEFSYTKKLDKKKIKSYLNPTTIKNPDYLVDDSNEELIFKKLDYYFEWTPFTVLDTQKSEDYSGVYAFIAFLLGLGTSKRLSKELKIHALRIRHQESGVNGYFYSYAILNDCSLLGGYEAGWIIFLTCATDYSGHGGSMHELSELYIDKFEKEGKLSIKQVDVNESDFRQYIKRRMNLNSEFFDDEQSKSDSNEEFVEYFSKLKETYQNIIDTTPTLKINNEMKTSISDDFIENLIAEGESQKIELKSSLRWNYDENRKDTRLEFPIVRSIAAFMNSDGGFLLIGVNDKKEKIGLEKDYSTLGKNHKNKDGFQLQLTEVLNNYIGKEFHQFLNVKIFSEQNIDICCVEVKPVNDRPVFVKNDSKNEFFIRMNNRCQKLEIHEFYEYFDLHKRKNRSDLN